MIATFTAIVSASYVITFYYELVRYRRSLANKVIHVPLYPPL